MTRDVRTCDWRELAGDVDGIDLLCVDAPYSEKTHAGHDAGAQTANGAQKAAARAKRRSTDRPSRRADALDGHQYARRYVQTLGGTRRDINYGFWTASDVDAFVDAWAPLTHGWFVSLTDDQLAPVWADALARHGRLVFSPLSCVEPGSRVRMTGDGPSQWSCLAVVARPRCEPYSKWGALPGAYVVPPGLNPRPQNGGKQVVGGKPLWLMEQLVLDYSKLGDLVVDPCCGAGTTGVAALRHGRRFIGCDVMPEHAEIAREALRAEVELSTLQARRAGQVSLFGREVA